MSRYSITMLQQGEPIQAVVGYDRPLDTFFLDVLANGEVLYTSRADNSPVKDALWLAERLAQFKVILPPAVYNALLHPGELNHTESFEILEISPIQAALLRMKGLQVLDSACSEGAGCTKVIWWLCPEDKTEDMRFLHVDGHTVCVVLPLTFVPEALQAEVRATLSDEDLLSLLELIEPVWVPHKEDIAQG